MGEGVGEREAWTRRRGMGRRWRRRGGRGRWGWRRGRLVWGRRGGGRWGRWRRRWWLLGQCTFVVVDDVVDVVDGGGNNALVSSLFGFGNFDAYVTDYWTESEKKEEGRGKRRNKCWWVMREGESPPPSLDHDDGRWTSWIGW